MRYNECEFEFGGENDGKEIIRNDFGSTAIPSIWAKPIVDILVEIPKGSNLLDYKALIINNGYICMSQSENGLSFNKGYTENGFAERVFHLHLRYVGDNNELYFRDYLIEHPDIANILTGCRIFGSILLLFFPAFSLGFYIIYLLCGFSDKVHRHSCMLHCNTFCNSRGGLCYYR